MLVEQSGNNKPIQITLPKKKNLKKTISEKS